MKLRILILTLSAMLTAASASGQPGITKVQDLNDSIYQSISSPLLDVAPAIVRIPIVALENKTLPVVEVGIEGRKYRFYFDTGSSDS